MSPSYNSLRNIMPSDMPISSSSIPGQTELPGGSDFFDDETGQNRTRVVRAIVLSVLITTVVIGLGIFVLWLILHAPLAKHEHYALYGDSGQYPTTEGLYAAQDIINASDRAAIEKYLQTLQEYQVEAYAKLDENELKYSEDARNIEYLWAWSEAAQFYYYRDDKTLEIVENKGAEVANEYVQAKYATLLKSSDKNTSALAELLVEAQQKYIKYIMRFEANGCRLSHIAEYCRYRDYDIITGETDYAADTNRVANEAFDTARDLLKIAINNIVKKQNK